MARHVGRAIRMKQKIRMKKQEVPRVMCSGVWLRRGYFSGRLCRCYPLIIIAVPIVPGGEGVRQ
ncbi:hypothetical protein MFFDBJGM_03496 [Pectobacterium versatile]|nr:hypothetical protein MFFDBJGM_03496 [Pectobacterium versatile]